MEFSMSTFGCKEKVYFLGRTVPKVANVPETE